jgi:hypothetical protein
MEIQYNMMAGRTKVLAGGKLNSPEA